ncbi:MAG: hypothetical protein DMG05_26245 [Acidobacteria bacterium]|nr:MAG: hypothetical protein DMG05_26245 [Acidobacteriota bacterium]
MRSKSNPMRLEQARKQIAIRRTLFPFAT